MPNEILIEVAYALPKKQLIIPIKVKLGTTAQEAIQLSGIIKKFPDLAAVEHLSGIYHLCARGQTSWFGFAEKIFAHSLIQQKPKLHPITTADYPTPAVRPKNSVMNTDKFEQNFAALPTWDAALGDCLQQIPTEAPQLLKAN